MLILHRGRGKHHLSLNPRSKKGLVALLLFILIFTIPLAVALTTTIVHTVPPTNTQVISSVCSTLTLSNPITIPTGSGIELLTCGSNPAFSSTTGSSTPSFSLPTGYDSLRYLPADSNALTNCGNGSGSLLTSGAAVSFATGSWDYCAVYSNAPALGLSTFTITWAQ